MQCPKDGTALRERERETAGGIVVLDVCPSCGGFWLDQGELEKLSASEDRYYRARYGDRDDDDNDDDDDERRRRQGSDLPSDDRYDDRGRPRRKRGGFLGELFEGFGGG
jgi:uncharacterized protein